MNSTITQNNNNYNNNISLTIPPAPAKPARKNNQETFIPENSGIPTDLTSQKLRYPVGKNQFVEVGFQRTLCKEIFDLCSQTALLKLNSIIFVIY